MLISVPLKIYEMLGSSETRLGGNPWLVAGLIISVHWVKSMRPIDWMPWRVFSMADVTALAWKFPPCRKFPSGSRSGLSVAELLSVVIC